MKKFLKNFVKNNEKKYWVFIVIIVVFALITITVYRINFSGGFSNNQADWGAFGDYLGGILNPFFAFLAFIGVLASVGTQSKQRKQMSLDRQGEEILVVVKDIDARISELMKTYVSTVTGHGKPHSIYISHMLSEFEFGARASEIETPTEDLDSFSYFIKVVKEPGTLEVAVNDLRIQVVMMHKFLIEYPKNEQGGYAAIVEYYIIKNQSLALLLNYIKPLPAELLQFFYPKGQNS